ncbi:MAG: ferritin-like domain-containing protein [Pseudomonadota bacterium]|nr:ferritin-like domain-containing protein [Pseudomonadota bacterium]
MATQHLYALPVEQTDWHFDGATEVHFTWEYDDERDALLNLYDKGKKQQWDAAERIDWSQEIDWENPMSLPDQQIPIYGSDTWNKMNDANKAEMRRHLQSATLSQFLHGEQGALIATSKIVATVPDADSKFYAATQVMDEARHVEAFSRLLHEKMQMAYPITPGLKTLLEQGLSDRRWDMTYLTMQILIEGLALAAFQRNRDFSENALVQEVHAYVMQDEARHVAFGRLALRDYYPQLTEAEREEREQFVVEACYHMRDRFTQIEVWENLGFTKEQILEAVDKSQVMAQFRGRLFSRIVPTVRDIGLWGPTVRKAYADMGVMQFSEIDAAALLEADGRVADEFDARKFVAEGTGAVAAE